MTLKDASVNDKTIFPETGPVQIELVRGWGYTRRPCNVCGGCTEKNSVLAEGPERFRVCETCLKAGDINARLMNRAEHLQKCADWTRGLIGRLQVPTYAEWEAAEAEEDRLTEEWYREDDRKRKAHALWLRTPEGIEWEKKQRAEHDARVAAGEEEEMPF